MAEAREASFPYVVIPEGRPTALLVHGFLDGDVIWREVTEGLNRVGISVATVNLPGMGGTSAEPEHISLDAYARAVVSVLEAIGNDVVLVGHSMGAQVAELAAHLHPGNVKGLVLLTPVPLAGLGAPDAVVAPFRAAGGKAEVQRGQRQALSCNLSETSLDALVALSMRVRPDVVAHLVDVWNEGHELGRVPSTFPGPVLVVRGETDPIVGEELISAISSRFTYGATQTIADAGHWVHVEQPTRVAQLILGVVQETGLAPATGGGVAVDWRSAFVEGTQAAFGEAFAPDVQLEAVVLAKPVNGRENVQLAMETANKIYRQLRFTDQASSGNKQYVEWIAEAHEGIKFEGVTILTRNESGAISHIAIHHRPIQAAIFFSRKLSEVLKDRFGRDYFVEDQTQGEAA